MEIVFANMSKHDVNLTLVMQTFRNTLLNLYYVCHYVKTRRQIEIMFANVSKWRS